MKIYLDTCSLQRPLDNKSELRILLESEAVLGLLAQCESGVAELVSSEALIFEVERNPNLTRQEYALEILARARSFVVLESFVQERARELRALGFQPLDALHLASAEAGQADYLCTCDDRFLRRARTLGRLATRVVSPLELIGEIERW
jgi:predicted nucleic acid-binding protein